MGNKAFEVYIVNPEKCCEGHREGRWVKFPCTKDKLQEALTQIGVSAECEEYFISEYYSDTVFCLNRVLGEHENVENLNYLAKRLQEFTDAEMAKFNVIMEDTTAVGAVSCINLTYNLEDYDWYPKVYTRYDLHRVYGNDISERGWFTLQGYVNRTQFSQNRYSGKTEDIPAEYRMKRESVLFSVIQCGFENHFRMEEQSLDALMRQFKSKQHPFTDMEGEMIGAVTFAGLVQSNEISLSVTADIDNDELKVYEINGVPEGGRTDDNSNIWYCGLTEYVNGLETHEEKDLTAQSAERCNGQFAAAKEGGISGDTITYQRISEVATKALSGLVQSNPISAEKFINDELGLTSAERKYFGVDEMSFF